MWSPQDYQSGSFGVPKWWGGARLGSYSKRNAQTAPGLSVPHLHGVSQRRTQEFGHFPTHLSIYKEINLTLGNLLCSVLLFSCWESTASPLHCSFCQGAYLPDCPIYNMEKGQDRCQRQGSAVQGVQTGQAAWSKSPLSGGALVGDEDENVGLRHMRLEWRWEQEITHSMANVPAKATSLGKVSVCHIPGHTKQDISVVISFELFFKSDSSCVSPKSLQLCGF